MKKTLITLLAFGIFTAGLAQNNPRVVGEIKILQSEILDEEREIVVFTPQNYQTSNEKFPVFYLLDGEWNFHFVSSLVDKLADGGDVPKMIVVGINNTNRNRDLTPPEENSNPNSFGGGKKFLNFIIQELQPWIDQNYRTHPYSILGGHSFGGLFTVYAMMEEPGFFQSYIALSPSLGRNNEKQLASAKNFFNKKNTMPKDLYLAVGNEGGFTYLSTAKFANSVERSVYGDFRFKFDHLKEETHTTIPVQGFLNGLRFIYAETNPEKIPELNEIFLIENHFKQLSERYGYEFQIPEFYYQKFMKEQLAERELDYALFILKRYEAEYPNSPNLFMGYADTYLLKGDFKMARSYYEKLKQLGVEDESLDRLLDQIKN